MNEDVKEKLDCDEHFARLERDLRGNSSKFVKEFTNDYLTKIGIEPTNVSELLIDEGVNTLTLLQMDSEALIDIIAIINECAENKMSKAESYSEIVDYISRYFESRTQYIQLVNGEIDPITNEKVDNKLSEYESHILEA